MKMRRSIRYTKDTVTTFQYIEKLDKEQLEKIIQYFSVSKPKIDFKDIVEDIIEITSLEEDDLINMIQLIYSSYSFLEDEEMDWNELADDIKHSDSNGDKEFQEGFLWDKLIDFINKIINSEYLKVSNKGIKLIGSNSNTFIKAQIISDIRSIFKDDVEENPECAVILHNLKIRYLSNDLQKEFFLTLDIKDLKDLKGTIDRAITKHDKLKETMNWNDIHIMG